MRHRFFFAFPLALLLALFMLAYFASQRSEMLWQQR